MSVRAALDAALKAEPPDDRDRATVALARAYADLIDDGETAPLLPVLEALQMSPRARAAAQRGMKPSVPARGSQLDELRKRRARKHGAPDLDATAT